MNFNFDQTAGISQSTTRQQLAGNAIHEVTFDGCEIRDFDGVQNPNQKFHNLDIKFSNADGVFVHTVWEPRDSDMEDRVGPFGALPSNAKAMMLLFKHLIDAVNPELAKKIDAGEVKITANDWNKLREVMVKATDPGKGKATKIKLLKNNKGEAIFPYFANYNRAGALSMSTNFIGDHIFFTNKELTRIEKESKATPTPVDAGSSSDPFNMPTTTATAPSTTDWDF